MHFSALVRRFCSLAPCLFLALHTSYSGAQEQTMIAQGGSSTPGSYQPGGIDTINLQNGSVVLNIPVLAYPQKGNKLKFSFSLKYSPTPWYFAVAGSGTDASTETIHSTGEWRNQDPQVSNPLGVVLAHDQGLALTSEQLTYPCINPSGYCGGTQGPHGPTGVTATYAELYSLVTADRGVHNFGIEGKEGSPGITFGPTQDGSNFAPIDSTHHQFAGPDGVTYSQTPDPSGVYDSSFNQSDPDGNTITVNASGWTDSLGRQIPGSRSGPGLGDPTAVVNGDPLPGIQTSDTSQCTNGAASARTFAVPAFNGQTATYTLCFNNVTASTAFTSPYQPNDENYLITENGGQGSGTYLLLTQVVLPNQTSYKFAYDNYIELTSVTLPTGGTISYGYQTAHWNDISHQQSRVIQTRTVTDVNGTAHTWTYAITPQSYGADSADTLITDSAGNDEDHSYSFGVGDNAGKAIETITSYSGTGSSRSAIKTTVLARAPLSSPITFPSQDGTGPYVAGPVVSSTTTWANTNQVSKTVYTQTPGTGTVQWVNYNNNFNGPSGFAINTCDACFYTLQNQIEQDYDYGNGQPGPLLRTTITHYKWQDDANYLNANLINLPASVCVPLAGASSCTPSTADTASYASYAYDEQNGSPSGVHGNQTSASVWTGFGPSLSTSTIFNTNGLPQTITDAMGRATSMGYDSSGAFLSSITAPATNGVNHTTGSTYDDASGLLMSATDENGGVTTYSYDSMSRLKSATSPVGNTGYSYFDLSPTQSLPYYTSSQSIDGSRNLTQRVDLDGFGRTVTSTLTSDPNGPISTETMYDALGRVYSVTNPHYPASVSFPGAHTADGTTINSYDPLGRIMGTSLPDGNTRTSSYAGNVITRKDEAGSQWQQLTDGLGRLTEVMEPDPATGKPAYETDYTYDALGNPIQIDQWGGPKGSAGDRVRTFTYDGASRLLTTIQPESGTTTYGYLAYGSQGSLCSGAASNVCSKTDARGAVAAYSYDELGRLTGTTYPKGGAPAVTFAYDTAKGGWNFPGQTFPNNQPVQQNHIKGRLSWAQNANATIVYGYDAGGRTELKSVCTPVNCATGDHYDMHLAYDGLGNPTFTDLGRDALLNNATPNAGYYYGGLTLAYSSAGRLTSANADIVDATHPASIGSMGQYNPLGSPGTVTYGGALTVAKTYTPRGWLHEQDASIPTANLTRTDQYDYYPNGTPMDMVDSLLGTTNYSFDRLSRLTSFTNPYAGVNYGYDPWANLITHTQTAGSGYTYNLQMDAHNHIAGLGYDASGAGTMTADGLNQYTYDADAHIGQVEDLQGNTKATYLYDPEGRRAVKQDANGAVQYQYLYSPDGTLTTTLGPDSKLVRGSQYGGGEHLADYTAGTGAGGGRTELRLMDTLGTLFVKVDQAGNVLETCGQDPFGEALGCSPGLDYTETHFTDKLRDGESTLDYSRARYYNSTLGRFTIPDPSGLAYADPTNPQSFNAYAYALNNPLTDLDPTGLSCIRLTDDEYNATPADNGDGLGCADAGVLPDTDPTMTANGDTTTFDQSGSTNVTAPQQGQDLSFDADVAYDQQYLQIQQPATLTDDQRIQQLAIGVTQDSQHSIGCVAQAYGLGAPGEITRNLGQPREGTKPFITPGTSRGTSPISELARSLPRIRGSFRAPVGGPGTGSSLRMAKTGSLFVAAARYAPFIGLVSDIVAAGQLASCLGGQ